MTIKDIDDQILDTNMRLTNNRTEREKLLATLRYLKHQKKYYGKPAISSPPTVVKIGRKQ